MNPHRRLQNLLAYGQTTTAMRDAGATPLVQASFGDLQVLDDLQIIQHFGYSSSPPAGTNVVAAFGTGSKSKGLILGTVSPATRRKLLLSGETVVHDAWGNEAHFSEAGLTIKHATQVTIQVGSMSAVFSATGLTVTGGVTAGLGTSSQVTLQSHTHPTARLGSPSIPTPGT